MSQREPFGKANLDRETLCCSLPTDPLYPSHLTILLQGMLTLGVKHPFAQFRPDGSSTWQEVSQASASNQSYLGQLCSTKQSVWHLSNALGSNVVKDDLIPISIQKRYASSTELKKKIRSAVNS
jgi:hypothetical protein